MKIPTVLLTFALALMTSGGCGIHPEQPANRSAQDAVKNERNPPVLSEAELQQMETELKAQKAMEHWTGKVYRTSGWLVKRVVSEEVNQNLNTYTLELEPRGAVNLKYKCYFADEHRSPLLALAMGSKVTVRGKLKDAGHGELEFIGCLLDVEASSSRTPDSNVPINQEGPPEEAK